MTAPTTFEFAQIGVRAIGATTTATYFCGIQTTGFNRTAQTSDRFVRDCQSPAVPPERRVKVTGKQRDITGSGLANSDQLDLADGLEGVRMEYFYKILDISDPVGTPAGTEIGTWNGPGVATAVNLGTSENNDATIELTIASDGAWTYTPAP